MTIYIIGRGSPSYTNLIMVTLLRYFWFDLQSVLVCWAAVTKQYRTVWINQHTSVCMVWRHWNWWSKVLAYLRMRTFFLAYGHLASCCTLSSRFLVYACVSRALILSRGTHLHYLNLIGKILWPISTIQRAGVSTWITWEHIELVPPTLMTSLRLVSWDSRP